MVVVLPLLPSGSGGAVACSTGDCSWGNCDGSGRSSLSRFGSRVGSFYCEQELSSGREGVDVTVVASLLRSWQEPVNRLVR